MPRPLSELRGYQRRGVVRIYREPATGLLVDMSLGKTITTLTAARSLIRHGKRRSALAVMPMRVQDTETWQTEAKAWEHTQDVTFQVITHHRPKDYRRLRQPERKAKFKKQWQEAVRATQDEFAVPADIYITVYDNLAWLAKLVGPRRNKKPLIPMPDILILDESSMIKNSGSLRFKALQLRLLRFFKTVVILTGTPMPNSLMELWPQIYVLDEGARLGTSHGRFRERFFERTDYMGFKWEPREGATERVLELCQDLILRLDAEDWVKLPKIVANPVPVRLPAEVMHLYRQHEREMFTQLTATKSVTAVTAATLSMQCHQIANGAIYDDPDERSSWTALHGAKLAALEEIIEEHPGQSLMVAYWFRHDLVRLRQRWPDARLMGKKNAKQTIDDWNDGKIPLLFVHPRSSGHGLNLQHGGHIVVWFSLTWSLEAHDQLIGRLRRPDQASESIIVHYLMAQDTVDDGAIMPAIRHKDHSQRAVLNALREYTLRKFKLEK
jgi:SNF2 family DNA or RNA helicase